MIKMREQVKSGETPAKITVSMIDTDLKNGISKSDMAVKYGIKPWEVDEMFKHPFLKGRRPSRKKALSFTFVDDTEPLNSGDIAVEQAAEVEEEFVDPNQVTLEQAIDEAIESVGEIKDQMQETQDAIIDMLSPTEFETPEETIAKVNGTEIKGRPSRENPDDELGYDEDEGATEWDGEEIDNDDFYLPGDVEEEELEEGDSFQM
jgi:hypothetical protein